MTIPTLHRLIKKGVSFVWDQHAFEDLKKYLINSSVFAVPVSGTQTNELGHEQAIYYLSRTTIGAEYQYTPVEKKVFGSNIHSLEDATLLGGQNNSHNL